MSYVLVYSIAESLGILRHMIKSSSAVAYIVSFFCSSYVLCAIFCFITVVFANVFLFLLTGVRYVLFESLTPPPPLPLLLSIAIDIEFVFVLVDGALRVHE
jgi:hypothetical protein